MILKDTLAAISIQQRNSLQNMRGVEVSRFQQNDSLLSDTHMLVISGVRRCGKSTLLRQLLRSNDGHYFNFEDPRVANFDLSDFDRLEEVFHAQGGDKRYYFDEVQNVPQWERYIRSAHDRGLNFVLTGSNASLLSKELGTKLTGRYLMKELFPFSYAEYNRMIKAKASLQSFEGYLEYGGFPDYVRENNPEILHQLLRDVINRDILVRYGLRQPQTINDLAIYLLSNVGRKFSYNKLSKLFEIKSTTTTITYGSYLEDTYLLFTIPMFSYSLKKQKVNQKKLYAIDTGFIKANTLSFSADKGRLLENLVFLTLRRKYSEIYYFEGRGECDFVVRDKGKVLLAVQVCYQLTEQNLGREVRGLENAIEETGAQEAVILSMDQEDEIHGFKVIPVWKWIVTFDQ